MSTTTSSGGSAGDKHFVDTVGAWTSTGTHDPQTTITVFFKDTNSVTGSKTDFNVWNNTGLAALMTELGYTPAKFFQFYKVVSLEYWLTDIDYGTMYDSEPQTWNVYMAPWLNSPYQASSTFLSITPNYLPGCVWKKTSLLHQLETRTQDNKVQVQTVKCSIYKYTIQCLKWGYSS